MDEPVSVPCCDANYERVALLSWMRKHGNRCPQSGNPLLPSDLKPNARLQWEILYLERTNSKSTTSTENPPSLRSPISPPPNVDSPPVHPRSPREGCTRKSLNRKTEPVLLKSRDDTALDTASSVLKTRPTSRMDYPPLHPRSPREGCVRKALNGNILPVRGQSCMDTVLDASSDATQGMADSSTSPSSSSMSPPSKVDCPPLHPRSPRDGFARKSLTRKNDPVQLMPRDEPTVDAASNTMRTMAPCEAPSTEVFLPSNLDTSKCLPRPIPDRPSIDPRFSPDVSSCKVVVETSAPFCIQPPIDTTCAATPVDTTPPAPTATRRKRMDRPPTNPRSPPISSDTSKLSEIMVKRIDSAPALPQRCNSVVPVSMNTVLFPQYTSGNDLDACLKEMQSSPAKSLTTILDQVCTVLRMGE